MNKQTLKSKLILIAIVSIFLAFLGNAISVKTRSSVAPPIYDPISYYSKSSYTWSVFSQHKYVEAMNWFPYRPPGTALILYPTGFKPSVHRFLFRSVFAPVAIWAVALMVLILPWVRRPLNAVLGGALIAGLMSMPIFYQFQINDLFNAIYNLGIQWGLVDQLQGTVAALGVALMLFGISRRSFLLCLGGWSAEAFALFIKPSGILTMGVLFGIAIVELFFRWYSRPEERRAIIKSGAIALAVGALVYALALYLALSTDYMGNGAIGKGIIAQKIDIQLHDGPLLPSLYLLIQPVIGRWWFLPLAVIFIGIAIEAIFLLRRHRLPEAGLRLAVSVAFAAAAVWWWVNLAGMELRYLFPFLLMLIAWLIPDVFMRLDRLSPNVRKLAIVYCFIPYILLVGMLYAPRPAIGLQKFFGVNLTNDQHKEEVGRGQWLISQAKALNRPLNIYSMTDGIRGGVVEMVDWIDSIEHGNRASNFVINRPNNWNGDPGLRIQDLINSDFILMETIRPATAHAGPIKILDWREEPEYFKQFAYYGCGAKTNGLEFVSHDGLKVLKVVDAKKFADALYTWTQSIEWSKEFLERNKTFLSQHK